MQKPYWDLSRLVNLACNELTAISLYSKLMLKQIQQLISFKHMPIKLEVETLLTFLIIIGNVEITDNRWY